MSFNVFAYFMIYCDVLMARFRKHLAMVLTVGLVWVPAVANAQLSKQAENWKEEALKLLDAGADIIGILGALVAAVFFLIWIFKKHRNAQPDGELQKVLYGIAAGSFWFLYSLARGSIELGEGSQETDDFFS